MKESKESPILTRCGYRCDLCLAYKENINSLEDRERISDGWFKYFGFRVSPENISCDGCMTFDEENPHLIDKNCPVRRCVLEKGFENCSECEDYICENLESRMVDRSDFDSINERDHRCFVKPYESRERLEKLR